jgi:hypothetical protein
MYAGFTFLALLARPEKFTGNKQFLPLLAVILLGFSMEVLQSLTHYGRSFDLTGLLSSRIRFERTIILPKIAISHFDFLKSYPKSQVIWH